VVKGISDKLAPSARYIIELRDRSSVRSRDRGWLLIAVAIKYIGVISFSLHLGFRDRTSH